jgi:transcriptional regulator with XRE-family HTH domain
MRTENLEAALNDVGHRLKVLRLKNGFLSCEDFAYKYDLPRTHYWKMENGKTNVTLKSLLKILHIYDLTLVDFFCMDVQKLAA